MSVPVTRRSLRARPVPPAPAPVVASTAVSLAPIRLRHRAGGGVVDALLWLAAAAGALCIALVVLAATAQISLILFSTGSMAPTIPAGSVAVVQRVDAAQIAVGDVVTVDRAGELPITHRVTSVAAGETADERVVTMRGDANAADDAFPYAVSSVRVVLFSVPGVATLVAGMGNPVVLGGLTLAASALVVWAFWPRSPHRRSKGRSRGRQSNGAGR